VIVIRNRTYHREKALAKTNHQSIQHAIDWLEAHQDDPDIDEPYVASQGHVLSGSTSEQPAQDGDDASKGATGSDVPAQAKSLKCDE